MANLVNKSSIVLPGNYDLSNILFLIDNESPGRVRVSAKDGNVTEQFAIEEFTESYDALMALVGYSYTDTRTSAGGSTFYTLARVPPAQHPLYSNFYCTEVADGRGLVFDGTYTPANNQPSPYLFASGPSYQKFLGTATFAPLTQYIAPDGSLDASGTAIPEYYRYISYSCQGRAEYLTRPIGNMVYKEGTPAGKTFPGQAISVERKADLEVTWHQVPEDWISANGVGLVLNPTKIFNGIGCVNSVDIWGFSAGTLLMLKPTINRYPAPLFLANPGSLQTQTFYCDITFKFVFFDPPLGVNPGYIQKGHNNKPYWAGETGSQTLYYYAAARKTDGTVSDVATYPTYAYATMFNHV